MRRYAKRDFKRMVLAGNTISLDEMLEQSEQNAALVQKIRTTCTQVGYSAGIYGCTGMLFEDDFGERYVAYGRALPYV